MEPRGVMTFALAVAGAALAAFVAAGPAHAGAQCGKAAWYDLNGVTASGEPSDAENLAAAHRSLPFGTWVRVENLDNGRHVLVRVNDRGPFVKGRVIDVTRAAAEELGFIKDGVTRVRVTVAEGDTAALPDNCGDGGRRQPLVQASVSNKPGAPRPPERPLTPERPRSAAAAAKATASLSIPESLESRFSDAFGPGNRILEIYPLGYAPAAER